MEKPAGEDSLNYELYKYTGHSFHERILIFLKQRL
jgi:hypothetical protein